MPLNPQVAALLDMMAAAPPIDYATAPVEEVRAALDRPMATGEPIALARVEDMAILLDGRRLDARLYVPEAAGPAPALTLYLHGGGWVLGTLETHDASCRALARESGSAILSLDYRRAPEHRYPAAVDDSYAVLCWMADNAARLRCDPARLAVAGDSAGANLAAAAAILARDRGGPSLRHQLLIYPVTDNDFATASYRQNGSGDHFLSQAMMAMFWRHYLGDIAPEAAPLARILHTPDLSGLPPATVIVAEYDPLRDEGLAYGKRLGTSRVPTNVHIAEGMIHGFFGMFDLVPDAWRYICYAGAALRDGLD